MNIDKFITLYKASNDKEKFCLENCKNKYIPFLDKVVMATKIVNSSSMVDKKYVANSVARFVFFVMAVLEMYYDVEYDKNDIYKEFDKINRLSMTPHLCKSVSDIDEFRLVLTMTLDDFRENNLSIPAFLDTKFDAINLIVDDVLDKLNK